MIIDLQPMQTGHDQLVLTFALWDYTERTNDVTGDIIKLIIVVIIIINAIFTRSGKTLSVQEIYRSFIGLDLILSAPKKQ